MPEILLLTLNCVDVELFQIVENTHSLLAQTMHHVSNDLVPSNLKDLFIPTTKIHSYNTRSSVSKNCYIQKSNGEI